MWSAVEGVLAVLLLLQLRLAWRRYHWQHDKVTPLSFTDSPTISICIPARNEMFALAECLDTVLASDYPKLEILVLDDASQDNTSQLIRSYAHAGVRFIEGDALPDGWLGRNYALQTLAKAASGQYIVFMGVDTRLGPATVSKLVNYMYGKRAAMVSVLPPRQKLFRASSFFASFRYFWQLLLPQFVHVPATSALWMVRAEALEEVGFEQVKHDILPENSFAAHFMKQNTYRFLIGDQELGATYMKKWSSQAETAVRQYFPALKKSLFMSVVAILGLLIVGLLPFIAASSLLLTAQFGNSLLWFSLVVCLGLAGMYGAYAKHVLRIPFLIGCILFPFLLVQEIAFLVSSIYAYSAGAVRWKGRTITRK